MQRIRPDVADPRMKPGNLRLGFVPVGRSLDLAGQRPRQPLEPGQIGAQRLRPGNAAAVAQGCQTGNAKINATCRLVLADRRCMVHLDMQADKPSVGGTRHDRRFYLAGEA